MLARWRQVRALQASSSTAFKANLTIDAYIPEHISLGRGREACGTRPAHKVKPRTGGAHGASEYQDGGNAPTEINIASDGSAVDFRIYVTPREKA